MKIKLSYLLSVAFAMSPGRSLVHKLANGSANSLVQFSRIEREAEEEEEIKDSGLRFTMWRIVTCAAARSVLRA